MYSSPEDNGLIFKGSRGYTVNLVIIMFTVLAALLVGVGTVSFVGAREIEKNYSLHLSKTIEKLEIVNKLHLNTDNLRNIIAHITSPDIKDKSRLIGQLKQEHDINTALIRQLDSLIVLKENKEILKKLIEHRKLYYKHSDSIVALVSSGRLNGAQLYSETYLVPQDKLHQQYLSKLSSNFQKVADQRDSHVSHLLANFARHQEIILALVLIGSISTIFLIQYLFKKMKQENLNLSNEIKIRQELQNELYKSQHIYKTLFDSNPLPILIYDFNTLNILKANNAASAEYGYTQEEFLKLKISDLKLESDLEHYFTAILPNPKEHSVFHNIKHKRKDGSEFRAEIHAHALPEEEDMKPRLVVAVNVEEQYNAIEKIERNEKQLREISSSIPGAVYQFQMTKELRYSFPFISNSIKRLYGVSPEEVYERPSLVYKNVHPSDLEGIQKSTLESFRTLKPWVHEFRVWQAEQKKYLWVRGHSLPTKREDGSVQWNGTFIDITSQKDAQEELIRNEANLRALLDSSQKAIFLLDADLKVMSFNRIAAEYVRDTKDVKLKTGQQLIHLIDIGLLPELREDHAHAMKGREIVFETGNAGKWYEVAYKPAISKDNQVVAVALSIANITEQRNIVEAIRKSEAQLTKAQALTKLGSWEYDFSTKLFTASNSLYEIYELSPKIGPFGYNVVKDLFYPGEEEIATLHIRQALLHKSGIAFDHRILLGGGKVKYLHTVGELIFNHEGQVVKIAGATQDISELKQKEQEARDAREKLQATLENIPEIIFSADAQLNVFYVSPQVQKITGYTENEVIGSREKWAEIIHPDDFIPLMAAIKESMGSATRLQHELRIVTKTGEIRWIELRYSPLLDSDGKVHKIDGSATDITDKKQEESRRQVLTEQLQKQNHHLQQFTYIVSHNLRAPIANIMGLTSIYDKRRPDALLNQRVIDNLSKSAQLLDSTIRDLNEILAIRTRVEESKETVDFKQTLEHILASVSGTEALEEADIKWDFNDAPDIVAVRSYVYSIMLNLVTNALKYRADDRKLKLYLKTSKVLDYICLEVQDNGQGINLEQNRDKIFGLYKRFHHNKEGKGIGLHLVKTQAELLGGKVEVDSMPDLGSNFKVYLKYQS
mgnify:CR=1 FL=1